MHEKTKPVLATLKIIEEKAIKKGAIAEYKGKKYFACTNDIIFENLQIPIGNLALSEVLKELMQYGVIEYEVVMVNKDISKRDATRLGMKQDTYKFRVMSINWECEFLKNNM